MTKLSGPARIRELLKQPGIIRSLGAHDVFTALIVEQAGFEDARRLSQRGIVPAELRFTHGVHIPA